MIFHVIIRNVTQPILECTPGIEQSRISYFQTLHILIYLKLPGLRLWIIPGGSQYPMDTSCAGNALCEALAEQSANALALFPSSFVIFPKYQGNAMHNSIFDSLTMKRYITLSLTSRLSSLRFLWVEYFQVVRSRKRFNCKTYQKILNTTFYYLFQNQNVSPIFTNQLRHNINTIST